MGRIRALFKPFPSIQLENVMVDNEGESVGQGGGVTMCMVVGSHLVVMIDRAAFKCGVFQVEDMPAVPGVFRL